MSKRSKTMPRSEILHVLETSQVEGSSIARIVAALAGRLDPERYRLHAWFRRDHGPLAGMLAEKGVAVQCLDGTGGLGPAGLLRFGRAVRCHRFALVHQHAGGRAVRWASRVVGGARVITHLHDRGLQHPGDSPVRFRAGGADLVVATSRVVAEWAGCGAEVVYPGVDVRSSFGNAGRGGRMPGHVVGAAGRLAPLKGMSFLLRALSLVRQRVPDVTLELAGSGPEERALRSETERLGLGGCVRFLGWQEEIPFHRWNVFAMPSLEEPFGMVALEAMAAGVPVVASGVGGLVELVEDGRSGWLVPPADTQALALRLTALLQNEREQEDMGRAALARAEEFSAGRMCGRIERLYERLLTGASG